MIAHTSLEGEIVHVQATFDAPDALGDLHHVLTPESPPYLGLSYAEWRALAPGEVVIRPPTTAEEVPRG